MIVVMNVFFYDYLNQFKLFDCLAQFLSIVLLFLIEVLLSCILGMFPDNFLFDNKSFLCYFQSNLESNIETKFFYAQNSSWQ